MPTSRAFPAVQAVDPMPVPPVATTIDGAARALSISRSSVYELLGSGALEAVRIGGGTKTLIIWRSVLDYLARAPRWQPSNPLARTVAATRARTQKRLADRAE